MHVDPEFILKQKDNLKNNLPVYESYPDWMWQLGSNELGKAIWEREALAMNIQASVVLRVNTLKTTEQKFEEAFKEQQIELRKISNSAYELVKRENVFQNKLFKEGWFEVQDAGSQLI